MEGKPTTDSEPTKQSDNNEQFSSAAESDQENVDKIRIMMCQLIH